MLSIYRMHKIGVLVLMFSLIAAAPKRPEIISIVPGTPARLAPGGTAEYSLVIKILSGYHVQANPASEEYLIPTTVSLEKADGIVPLNAIYPKGIGFKLQGSDKEIQTYENENTVRIPLQAEQSAIPGETILKGSLRYQGCDATTCFPPKSIAFEAKVTVVKP